jgi:hypothetical protein
MIALEWVETAFSLVGRGVTELQGLLLAGMA